MAAPVCYNCDSGCNDTVTSNDGNMNNFEWVHSNRTRRRSTIEQRSCYKFQLELVLIPLSIAMIPLGLCALLLCVCFCGPKESRGKLPETFRKKAKIDAKDANEIDNEELTCKNGIIMRKDSKKTRFSTTISFIEANCTNDKMNKNEQSVIPNSLLFAAAKDEKYVAENDETVTVNNNNQTATTQISMNERKLGDKKENDAFENDFVPRRIISKHTRFSDNIHILGELKT